MRRDELPRGFEYFDPERPKVPFISRDGRQLIGWHIINVYDLESYSSQYMIRMHRKRLGRLEGSELVFGSPTLHFEESEVEEGCPEMHGLYHIEKEDCVTSIDSAQIQAEAHRRDRESLSHKTREQQS